MQSNKAKKISNEVVSVESANFNFSETLEKEQLDASVVNNYEELNTKCDKVITKIKLRKIQK